MASGELRFPAVDESDLPVGAAVTASGRVSGVVQAGNGRPICDVPFDPVDLARLDDALARGTRHTGIRFTVYVGPLGADPHERTRELFATLPHAAESALIAVSPGEHSIEVVSGSAVSGRLSERVAQLGISAAIASFGEGDLIDGLVSALRVMTAAVQPIEV